MIRNGRSNGETVKGLFAVSVPVRQEAGTFSMGRLWREGPTYPIRSTPSGNKVATDPTPPDPIANAAPVPEYALATGMPELTTRHRSPAPIYGTEGLRFES
jgi:hypothetical protein